MTVATFVPLLVGMLAIAGTYWNATRLERLKAELSLVNSKLEKLYGPLLAIDGASKAAWQQFRSKYREGIAYFGTGDPPSEDELKTWRLWMGTVFQPMNEKSVEIIINNMHLIEGQEIPQSLLDLIAHVEAYRVVLARWKESDYSEHVSLINFPEAFRSEIERDYIHLKRRQLDLIGRTTVAKPFRRATTSPTNR